MKQPASYIDTHIARHSQWQARTDRTLLEGGATGVAAVAASDGTFGQGDLFSAVGRRQPGAFSALRAKLITPAYDALKQRLTGLAPAVRPHQIMRQAFMGLSTGTNFARPISEALTAVTGAALTKTGLESFYDAVLPGYSVSISGENISEAGGVDFGVKWTDASGRIVATCGRQFLRDEDGSIDLHAHSVWVDPKLRGRNVSGRIADAETDLLRALSDHPRTRQTLAAGGMFDPNEPSTMQTVGGYAWAARGYDFADRSNAVSRAYEYGPRTAVHAEDDGVTGDGTLQQAHFRRWFDATLASGALKVDPRTAAAVRVGIEACEHPWQLASFRVAGLTVPVTIGDRTTECDLGKAYLLSGQAPYWRGVLFVNERGTDSEIVRGAYDFKTEAALAKREATTSTRP